MTYHGKKLFGKVKSTPLRYRYLFLFATIFGSLLTISYNNQSHTRLLYLNSTASVFIWNSNGSEQSFTIRTEGCIIPGLQPLDESIRKFVKYPENVKKCSETNYSLLQNNDTHIWMDINSLQFYKIPNDVNVTCCYKSFIRPLAISDTFLADDKVKYNTCINFTSHIEVMNEFIKVTCGYGNKMLQEQFFLYAPKKHYFSEEYATNMLQNQGAYNVIVMGIDAISRLNFYRTMPKTLSYLKKKGAIELLGYNKVGDNTFPNLIPMLLGLNNSDLKQSCWPSEGHSFDDCPFIWNWYKEAGFYTAFAEDSANLGTFNYNKVGFKNTPTDYYIHNFINEAEKHAETRTNSNSFLCMGNKYFYRVLLDYVESLTKTLKSSKLFGFFWEVTMSHDYLNYPMLMDKSYETFLTKLDSSSYLDDTILILLSDHGIRWGDIRFTKQGRLEERLPFVHILLPPSFKEHYTIAYENLKLNSKRLTTPFDIHATLSDLIKLDSIQNEVIQFRSDKNYASDKSISLFLPIPGNRSCHTAGIESHWCTCYQNTKLQTASVESSEASLHLVRHLNNLLRNYHQCAILTLKEVLEVTELILASPEKDKVGWREFMVVVRTAPGGGVFEATLRRDSQGWTLSGTASRLNRYGDQSYCLHHYQLKLYCFCHIETHQNKTQNKL